MRSAVVIFAIASGLVGGLFSSAWMNGMAVQRVQSTFALETAHIQFHHPEFSDNFDHGYSYLPIVKIKSENSIFGL